MTQSDESASAIENDDNLDREAEVITSIFNEAAPDYSPELEWVAMTLDRDAEEQLFVMEAGGYIDSDGLDALREAGWQIQYIEGHNHEHDDGVVISISIPVRGEGEA